MTTLYLDLETFSECDLKAHGTHRYAEHPSTEITVAQWAVDDNEAAVHDMTLGSFDQVENALREELVDLLHRPDVEIVAHNSVFDRTLLRRCWGLDIPAERWRDTMVRALAHGLPGALGKIGPILGLPEDQQKDKRGTQLIQLFCKPRPKGNLLRRATRETHPAEWAEFLEYSRQDIVSMRAIHRLLPVWNYQGAELALWHLDQRINDRGFAVDLDLAHAAIAATDVEKARLKNETIAATDGLVTAPSKRDDLLAFILAEYGVDLPDMKADTLRRRLEDPELPDGVKLLIGIRLEATKTSTAKYQALVKATSGDGRLRNTLQFAGALRTARWAGRVFQPQNLPRPTEGFDGELQELAIAALKGGYAAELGDDVMQLTSNCIRGAIVAPPGKKLVVADLSNIEGRMLAWLAGENWKLRAFRDFDAGAGPDLYKMAYARSFNVDPASVGKGMKRQIGKVMELGLGYEGGVAAFVTFAAVYRMDLRELADAVHSTAPKPALARAYGVHEWAMKQASMKAARTMPQNVYVACEVLKTAWREAHPMTSRLWAAAKEGVTAAIQHPGLTFAIGPHLKARRDGAWLRVRLPSGRYLCYLQPKVDDGGQISYMGVNQYTRQWTRIKTYGGKLIENCIAAGTPVLTEAGWVPIERAAGYRIWDGAAWVDHGGVVDQGEHETIEAFGARMTPDHQVFTTKGWRRASSCEGFDRAPCRFPHGGSLRWERWSEIPLAPAVRLWLDGHDARHRGAEAGETRRASVVRLSARGQHRQRAAFARDEQAPGLRRLGEHAREVLASFASGLGQLRLAWDRCCTRMGRLRHLLARHGADLRGWPHSRTDRQLRRLLADQLSMGDTTRAGEQHAVHPSHRHAARDDVVLGGSATLWREADDAALPAGSRLAGGTCVERVFDLIDCGPRSRFVVMGRDGRPLIVHNCTQAAARDVLASSMSGIEDVLGYEIVLTVHDELITEAPDEPLYGSDELAMAMSCNPPWAAGLPLAAAGFEAYRYRKD